MLWQEVIGLFDFRCYRIRFDKEGHLFFEFALVIPDVRRSFVKGSTMCVDHIGAGEFTIHFSPGDRGPHLLSLA